MKQILFSAFCIVTLFSACDTKTQSTEKTAETNITATSTSTATVSLPDTTPKKTSANIAAAPATLPPFNVKYVGKKGFYINGKFIGEMSEDKASKTIADAMMAYKKQGGIIPKDLNLEIVHDSKTSEPLMGQTGCLADRALGDGVWSSRPPGWRLRIAAAQERRR